jgi:hypothetical protein
MENKKLKHGGAGRGQGRKSRKELGLEPTVRLTTQVEQSVIDACKVAYGSIPEALRFAASQVNKNKP